MSSLFNIVLVFICISVAISSSMSCDRDGITWLSDPSDCSMMYICFYGQQFKLTCPQGSVADLEAKSCVPKGSELDICSKKDEATSFNCQAGSNIRLPNKESCAKYFACPHDSTGSGVKLEDKECSYPLLYDEDLKSCQRPESVKCGDRPEPKDPCDYEANRCLGAQCTPCYVRFPSCRGLPNGLNVWKGREETPYYVVCNEERVVFSGVCESTVKGPQIFSSKKKICVDLLLS